MPKISFDSELANDEVVRAGTGDVTLFVDKESMEYASLSSPLLSLYTYTTFFSVSLSELVLCSLSSSVLTLLPLSLSAFEL